MSEQDFPPPHPVQFNGSRLARALLSLAGWRIHFHGLPGRQGVAVVYPHTSNWDFIVLVMVKWATGIQACFWGKDSLFQIPLFGSWLRWLGGLPINRASPQGVVGAMVNRFHEAKARDRYLWLGLAPEGTRRLQPGWRSGFYGVTVQSQVPLALVRLDYGRREVRIDQFIRLSGQADIDYPRMARAFEGVLGYHPDQAAPIRPMARPEPESVESLPTHSVSQPSDKT
jgi:1-acyl-sn-glycerol-3-phosphate acyltransferase